MIDTPGHADFGGEVERVLRMADGALVLVDAAEGPMPQTRFVLSKALECRLQPIVIVNKIDRTDARPLEVLDEVFDLFLELGADDKLADFPYLFGSGRGGYVSHDPEAREGDLTPLLDLILERVPGPDVDPDAPLQMLVTTLDWSDYVGRIAIGRIQAGKITKGQSIALMQADDRITGGKVVQLHVFDKLGRVEVDEATAGDIAAVVGLDTVEIGDTIADREAAGGIAAADGRSADAANGVRRQYVALCRPRGKIPHQPAFARAAGPRTGKKRGPASGAAGRDRAIRGLRPRPAALVGAD